MGTPFDDMDFEQMKNQVEEAASEGRWIIFVGHEIGKRGYQVTDTAALEALCEYFEGPRAPDLARYSGRDRRAHPTAKTQQRVRVNSVFS